MGIIAVLLYGIMVTLSMLYPDISSMWVGAVLLVNLGTFIAAVVCLLVGFLVMPSLASDEVSNSHTILSCSCSSVLWKMQELPDMQARQQWHPSKRVNVQRAARGLLPSLAPVLPCYRYGV
jgi:uncharacterized membrane protein YgaE (UPF0421/DUF939 family)